MHTSSDIGLEVYSIIANRKINLITVSNLIKKIKENSLRLTLDQKYAIISAIASAHSTATKNWKTEINRLRNQILTAGIVKRTEKRHRTQRKNRKKVIDEAKGRLLTLDQMIKQASQADRLQNLDSYEVTIVTPKKQPIMVEKRNEITIPPFSEEMLEMMNYTPCFSKGKKPEINQAELNQTGTIPKYMEYQKLLTDQNGVIQIIANKPRAATTKNKRNYNIKKRCIIDQATLVSQGPNQLPKLILMTKMKLSKLDSNDTCQYRFNKAINDLNPCLTNMEWLKKRAARQKIGMMTLPFINQNTELISDRSMIHVVPDFSSINFEQQQQLQLQQRSKKKVEEAINQAKDQKATLQLHRKIETAINIQLYTGKTVSIESYCNKKHIKGPARGQLFYALLHMNYELSQSDPQHFGDICISASAQ